MGFRVVVKLSKFFTDERSSCYIYINDDIKVINNLESYLSRLFNIEGNFCLLKDNSLLPSCEDINVVQENDVISVIPLAERFMYNQSSSTYAEENVEVNEKENKKKKRKKNKEHNSADASNADISNIDVDSKEKSPNKENNMVLSCPEETNVKSKVLENSKLFTALQNIAEIHSAFYPQDEEDELEAMKAKALNTLKDHFPVNINGVSEGRIKKRKRIRIRKSKKNNQIEMLHSDSDSGKPQNSSTLVLNNGKKSSHIRFTTSEKSVNILQNDIVENIDTTPRIIRAMQSKPTTNGNITPSTINQNGKPSIAANGDTCEPDHESTPSVNDTLNNTENLTINDLTKPAESYPVINIADVKERNVILFKMLKLNEDYAPVISNHILGRVINADASNHSLKVSILDGRKECAFPSGKFNLEEETAEDNTEDIFDFTWDKLIEPRMVVS